MLIAANVQLVIKNTLTTLVPVNTMSRGATEKAIRTASIQNVICALDADILGLIPNHKTITGDRINK